MIALLSAPTNLGLRPPEPGAVPGTAKAPEALRAAGLHRRMISAGAHDAGVVLPRRYVDDDGRRPPGTIRNQDAVADHTRRLAGRLATLLDDGDTPLVLGGDCSLVLAGVLALRTRDRRAGLVHVDGHTDFRHPGNADEYGSLAGEDLAAAVGLHLPAVADLDGLGPYVEPDHAVHLGCRDDDAHLAEVRQVIADAVPASAVIKDGVDHAAGRVLDVVARADASWLQVDVDVLDPRWMPAVDSPDPDGLSPQTLVDLLREIAPRACGASVTVFDPDLDPDGRHTRLLADVVVDGLSGLGSAR